MGNCLKSQSSSRFAGDDEEWKSPALECSKNGDDEINNGKTREVKIKIKITKKQLEELLGEVDDVKELRVEQVLALLLNHSNNNNGYQRPWRPALQSIPEVN